ncbi:hypothetical protein [Laspinema olomoucense]|uniref:hypothetical protein n=1 Tax=Laspinema olomoucense TaxID=3231600 RepID=UPI0021BAD37F|nr:hypothetical protein [Laspinema sp. D3d]MCT7975650.1 hypothetical protein [Laspinema sp. D3d]
MSKTAILIVNAKDPGNKIPWLDCCLPQIERHSRSSDYQVYIANGNSEAEGRYIAATYPKIKVFAYRAETTAPAQQHSAGLDFLIERLDKEIEYFITLDSDAFPIRDRWIEILTSFIETGVTAVGVYRDEFVREVEPFLHVSCLCIKKQDYYNLGIRFADCYKPERDFSYHANCEWLKRKASLVGLRRSNVNNRHFLMAGVYGNLIYHNGAGSRPPTFRTSTDPAQNEEVWKDLQKAVFTNLDELITGLIDCPYDAIETLPIPTVRVKQQNMNLFLINRNWEKYNQFLENTEQKKAFTCGKGVFILGMHRSGTSCLTGMIEQYGLHLGEVSPIDKFNQKGNRENKVVMQINNELLLANGGYWYEPEEVQWVTPSLKERIEQFKQNLDVGKFWGIKDPRMLFCLSAWFQPDTLLAGTFRHPYEVIYSLKDRGNIVLSGRDWQDLWFRYNCQLISLYRLCPFPIVNFDWEPNRYRAVVQNLGRSLSLNIEREDFFDPELRHHRCGEEIQDPRARKLYSELVEIAECEEKKLQEVSKRPEQLQLIKLELERSHSRLSQIKAFLE